MKPGVNCWVVDTGAGYHLAPKGGRSKLEKETTREGPVLKLSTANGTIKSTDVANSHCASLDLDLNEVRILEKTPRVLSVQVLIDDGCEFQWNKRGAWLKPPRSRWIQLEIRHGVPLLPM